jgi:hypothetical protein
MHDRHANINQYILTYWTDEQLKEHLPAMKKSVTLIEMVLTAVPTATVTHTTGGRTSIFEEMLPPSSGQNE